MTDTIYLYAWGNNPRRAALKGRFCKVLARGKMNTVLVQFCDTREKVTTSSRALRETAYLESPVVLFRPRVDQIDLFAELS